MVRIARERIDDLFALARAEAAAGRAPLPDRYIRLARRIGMRYNVRLLPEYSDFYCRGCSSFWVEGRTVRTRLRGGIRVRSCLVCGRLRRVPLGPRVPSVRVGPSAGQEPGPVDERAPTGSPEGSLAPLSGEPESEED